MEKRKKSVNKALVADIQRASIHDGPGLRTTVFFKGCPLNCKWCHNPESISFDPEIMHYPEKCIGCGMCEKGCFSGAKVVCGKEYTIDELLTEIIRDKEYYGVDGGVTFSGGEPMAKQEFLSEIIDRCKEENINCAIETSLIYFNKEIFEKLDLVMADLKIWDSNIHEENTGVPNEKIKENFIKLNAIGVPIVARTPVIPGILQEIDKISEFLKKLENVVQYELLPYHPLGTEKSKALGKDVFEIKEFDKNYIKEFEKYAYIRR